MAGTGRRHCGDRAEWHASSDDNVLVRAHKADKAEESDEESPFKHFTRSVTSILGPRAGSSGDRQENERASMAQTFGGMFVESLLPQAERPRFVHQSSTNFDEGAGSRSGSFDCTSPKSLEKSSSTRHTTDLECGMIDEVNPMPRSAGRRRTESNSGKFTRSLTKIATHYHRGHEMTSRVIDRDAAYGQSCGHWDIYSIGGKSKQGKQMIKEISNLFLGDWYHTFLDTKIHIQLSWFICMYMFTFAFFAFIYLRISDACGLNLGGSFIKAYLLSLETMMTIGYGVPDPYMKGCWQGAMALTTQVLFELFLSTFLIGVVFQGISRPQARACTILFTERAVIRCIEGAHYLMFRVCDLRTRHSLIEAHLRLYCVHRHPVHGMKATAMRIDMPDDDLGASLLLTIPQTVVHRIDAWSPLAPQYNQQPTLPEELRRSKPNAAASDAGDGSPVASPSRAIPAKRLPPPMEQPLSSGVWSRTDREAFRRPRFPASAQRQVDSDTGNRDSHLCPFCGESFQTFEMLQIHCQYNQYSDEASGIPPEFCHRALKEEDRFRLGHQDPTREDIQSHLSANYCEVIVLVEGIEPTTSSTLQARHSYVVGTGPKIMDDDVVWDHQFAECCRAADSGTTGLGIDLGRFHLLMPE